MGYSGILRQIPHFFLSLFKRISVPGKQAIPKTELKMRQSFDDLTFTWNRIESLSFSALYTYMNKEQLMKTTYYKNYLDLQKKN